MSADVDPRACPAPIALRITGTGEYQPVRIVHSTDFDARWHKPAGWTQRHVGVASRRVAGADEPASHMGAIAAQQALAAAGLDATQVDCVISACSVGEQALPCTATLIHRRLGLGASGIPAFDINATCLSFLTALDLVSTAIAAGRWRRVLIVSSEVPSAGLNFDDIGTAALFGDGAGAVVVEAAVRDASSRFLAAHMETYSDGVELCQVRACGTRMRLGDDANAYAAASRFEMSGRETYRMAARLLPGYLDRLLARAAVPVHALDRIVPHQASGKALDHLQRALSLPADRLVRILATHGNQMAASIPIALHRAIGDGSVRRGDTIALVGSGAGLSFDGAVLRY